jgi:transposase InsO family protein
VASDRIQRPVAHVANDIGLSSETLRKEVRRAEADERLPQRIREAHQANYEAYGFRRAWKALRRAGERAARCQLQQLMRAHGIEGAKRRGKKWRTTIPDPDAHCRADLVQRQFTAPEPDRLWGGNFTYLRRWEGSWWLIDRGSQPGARTLNKEQTY